MILVDTSVWIDFFIGSDNGQVAYLENAINKKINICTCGIILTEVLQGIKNDQQYNETKYFFDRFIYFPMKKDTFISSANLYRQLRKKGITIRKPVDCMIAAVAIENDIPLLHNDKDFQQIIENSELKNIELL